MFFATYRQLQKNCSLQEKIIKELEERIKIIDDRVELLRLRIEMRDATIKHLQEKIDKMRLPDVGFI